MKNWKQKNNPLPEKSDNNRMKEFFRAKYVEKRFALAEESDDSSDSEEERRRRQKRKEKKKAKKKAAKKAADSDSSDDEPQAASKAKEEEKDDSDEGEEPVYKAKGKLRKRGLGAPPSLNAAAKPQQAAPQ